MSKTLRTINNEEITLLLDFIQNDTSFQPIKHLRVRNYCMTLLMLDAGLRIGELVRLSVSDLFCFEAPRDAVDIRAEIAKGGRSRIVPLSNRLRECIAEMQRLTWILSLPLRLDFAFHCFKPAEHISERQVQRIIAGASLSSFSRKITPHVLRHTFATRCLRTSNIRIVQQLLGHRSVSTTQIYTHPGRDDLKNAIDAMG